ncbi:hypothetical protein FLL45_08155 [Aliikangiella marina]|uniref:Uncharacterized protein n=1 Tax=Aliikangiella marina TaxID=1712262 RepID=A0A545TCH5_9GAMM|nr:hypothetical protein [Aliikangiella marina]TQV74922.1 hypothetical protein FLL45_08155 [Aliikangiella marina]
MKKLIYIVLILTSSKLIASEQIPSTKILSLAVYDSYAVVRLATPGQNAENCSHSAAGNWAAISFDSNKNKEMYSAILSARIADKSIGFGLNGCRNWGTATVPSIYRVDL